MSPPDYRLRFSLTRLLVLTALFAAWAAGVRVLCGPWLVWLSTALFYAVMALSFSNLASDPVK